MTRTLACTLAATAALLVLMSGGAPARGEDAAPLALRDGDRVTIVGGGYAERLQSFGYLETLLVSRFADRSLAFRNLGWSGDTVEGISRAVFGSPQDGFNRLVSDVRQTNPTVLWIAYGANEAHEGEAGLPRFVEGLGRLVDALATTKARMVILAPFDRPKLGPPLPDPAPYNASLARHREAMRRFAADRGLGYIDLQAALGELPQHERERISDDGVHFNAYGYWRTAPGIAAALGAAPAAWRLELNAAGAVHKASGLEVASVAGETGALRFSAKDAQLPYPPPPADSPPHADSALPERVLQVRDLPPGRYELRIDGQKVGVYGDGELAQGVAMAAGPSLEQAEQLRAAIGEKNALYFHRYRPQNETYLFLFRKHEQGNNAVEVPQFEPLVEQQEKRIAALRAPATRQYELVRTP